MSSFTTSINLLFGLPRFLFPGNSILSILLPIYPSSFLRRCPYHLSLASRVFSPNFPTCAVPLMYSFLILSILVTPNENRNIFNSATSISASCLFVSATVSNPYNIAGLTATLYTFPFTLAGTLLSHITPVIRDKWPWKKQYNMYCPKRNNNYCKWTLYKWRGSQMRIYCSCSLSTEWVTFVLSMFPTSHLRVGRKRGRPKQSWTDCVNRDMRAIGTTKDEVHDRTGWRRIVSAAATPQPSGSG